MTTEQSQTVAEIRERHKKERLSTMDSLMLFEIIDSQAAEIERLNTENNARSLSLDAARSEIERLTKERDEARKIADEMADAAKCDDVFSWHNRTLTQEEIDEMREAH